ncbi:MAG: FAD-binding protein [Acidobacteria bacterium]|nr:MAG: FAD-binding protein [Acidobacteriota bacterium]
MPADATIARAALEALRQLLGERLSTAPAVRAHHAKDESYHPPAEPDAVVFPESTAEVAAVVEICAAHRVPMVPFGAGTSLEGHVAALYGGVSIDLGRMDRVLQINAEDLDCRVEAGVTRKQLGRRLADLGLFFPLDPGADATLGGMAATRASGTNAVRYGTMRENVLGLTVVLPDARVIKTGGRARKSSAGYDLTRLFVGSEGTLGVITEVQLRLFGLPEAIAAAVCPFDDLEGAVATAIETIQLAIPVARIELLDEVQIDAVNRYSGLDQPVAPTLFFEFHGSDAGVREAAAAVAEIAARNGGPELRWATDAAAREKLWRARHESYYACLALRPGARGWPTDVCVPISRLADCILETRRDVDDAGLLAPIVGHVGDGNFHLVLVVDPDDEEEMARARRVEERMVERALQMGGTCSGEHGIGFGKIDHLEAEHGDAVEVMRQLKAALDPHGLMNPGKLFRL